MLGLAPFNSEKSSSVGPPTHKHTCHTPVAIKFVDLRFGFVYNVALVIGDLLISIICVKRIFAIDYTFKTALTFTIDIALTIYGISLVNALWLLTCIKRGHMARLLNRLVKVDSSICRLSSSKRISLSRSHMIGTFVVLVIIWVVLTVADNQAYHTIIFDWLNDIFPMFIIDQFMLQYILMVKVLEIHYKNLNNAAIDFSMASTTKTFRSFVHHDEITLMHCDYFPKINDFRQAHRTLCEIGSDVAEFYSLPILLTLALSCSGIIYNAYLLCTPFAFDVEIDTKLIVIESVAYVLVLLVPIALLGQGIDGLTHEMKKTSDAIYKMLHGPNLSPEDTDELEQFSIELLHRKIYFTAYGLFPLNRSLVQSIFSTTITYLVILLQFHISPEKPQ
ncbi:putative gustatory receptor 28b [Venturia canescens]|uniref:putative gustatory receptor 28b n=1 Tax=Venturia canescens TaxID=32260 RepID=UPI001C9C2EF6|nr:putative gustatory receptor 28b [Venturia canescens]